LCEREQSTVAQPGHRIRVAEIAVNALDCVALAAAATTAALLPDRLLQECLGGVARKRVGVTVDSAGIPEYYGSVCGDRCRQIAQHGVDIRIIPHWSTVDDDRPQVSEVAQIATDNASECKCYRSKPCIASGMRLYDPESVCYIHTGGLMARSTPNKNVS